MPKIQYLHKTRQRIPGIYAQKFSNILQNMNFSRCYRNRGKFIYGFDPNITIWDYIYEKRKTTIKEIGNQFLFSIEKVKKYVFQLAKMSLVAVKEEIVRVISNIRNARLGITIAVEAKISDWKNGLLQAQRYLLFSDYSYLALPEKNIRLVDIELLKKAGIGLLSIRDGELEEIMDAQKSCECEYILKYMHTSILFDRYKKENNKYIRRKNNIFTKYLPENVF